ncbi:MAG TPA: carbohydrate ABC transporter permease [Burkholderiales bacterium]|nr:carbohydrate ABC transporter permease [Burkholderiales bacterium]
MKPLRRLLAARRLDELAPAQKFVVYAPLLAWTAIVLFPLYWVIVTSLKEPIDVADGPYYIPFVDFRPSLHAWKYIFFDLGRDTLRPYLNSVIVSSAATLVAVLIGAMAAYGLARMEYRPSVGSVLLFVAAIALAALMSFWGGVDWRLALLAGLAIFAIALRMLGRRFRRRLANHDILFWVISQRILPPVVTAIPIYLMFKELGLLDTHSALIITYATVNLPIVVWLMYDFFCAVPRELEESAQIDGASRLRIFFDVALALVRPGLVATSLLVLILCWNEYLLALFLSTVEAQTMPLLVAAQNATRGPQWWYMSVLIIIMILPVIALTLLLQRFITKGLLVGAIKG